MRLRLLFSVVLSMFLFAGYSQITSVGLIGTATPGGWDVDTNMVQNVDSAHLWTLTITLTDGVAKFRADDDWVVNWGAADFPLGIGTQGGPDIPVYAGTYDISFNSNTGAYYFDIDSDISIIGDATAGGWEMDTEMYPDSGNVNGFFLETDLVVGSAKFRKDKDWAVNWGSSEFPTGVGVRDGDNIPVDKAGKYLIKFDTLTAEYSFESIVEFDSIGLIGDATPGGWDADTYLTQSANDPDLWTGNITLTDGELKFRANSNWDVNWGGGTFPSDTAVLGGDNIVATAGDYLVRFNTATLVYEFLPIVNYAAVGIIGDATPGGWDVDTDMEVSAEDPALWSLRVILGDGEAKFRADNDWAVNWGGGDFPSGVATQDGPNIPITAGEYFITFNTTTGEYNFEELVVFQTVGLIGPATPIGDWDTDVDMDKDPVDEQLWTIAEITLNDGEGKFRAEDAWAVNWGATDFPSGVGTQDGPNIPMVAGTWRITLRTDDGSYSFDLPSSIHESVLKSTKFYPNPASDVLNIELNAEQIKGEINVEIYTVSGERVLVSRALANSKIQINVNNLVPGTYFVRLFNNEFFLAKPLTIIK